VRVAGIGERLMVERREAWERGYGPIATARWGSAIWHTLAWALFGGAYIGATVSEIGFLRGFWMDGSRRLAWLEDYAASLVASADLPVPARIARGIRFEHVSFAYPG